MSSVKKNMVEYAAKQGDNKSVMCRKINVHVTSFRGDNLVQGIKTDALVRYISTYPSVNIYWLLNISDVLETKPDEAKVTEGEETYRIEVKKPKDDMNVKTDEQFIIGVLNRNNISLTETNRYLIERLKSHEENA